MTAYDVILNCRNTNTDNTTIKTNIFQSIKVSPGSHALAFAAGLGAALFLTIIIIMGKQCRKRHYRTRSSGLVTQPNLGCHVSPYGMSPEYGYPMVVRNWTPPMMHSRSLQGPNNYYSLPRPSPLDRNYSSRGLDTV